MVETIAQQTVSNLVLFYNNFPALWVFSTYVADRWRVVLKGEYPDYINAVFVNVSWISLATIHLWIPANVRDSTYPQT